MRTLFFLLSVFSLVVVACGDDDDDDNDSSSDDDAADDDDTTDDDTNDDDTTDDDAGDDDLEPRSFALSAAAYQYEFGPWSIDDSFDVTGFDGRIDLLSVHQDFFGLPWPEFAAGEDPPAAWVAVMEEIRAMVESLGVEVFLSVTPLSSMRDGLAALAREEGGELVEDEDWNPGCFDFDASPGATDIRTAYRNYVRWMVDFFDPPFVNHAIEMNMYDLNCPAQYDSLIGLVNEVYEQEKFLAPARVIFPSFTIDHLWGFEDNGDCDFGERRCLEEALARNASIERDRIGISNYPLWLIDYAPGGLPDDYYTAVAELTGETVVFAEIGVSSKDVVLPYPTLADPCFEWLPSDETTQAAFMQKLFVQADELGSDLLCWWSLRDFLPAEVLDHCPCQAPGLWCHLYEAVYDIGLLGAWLMWGSMGIVDYEQNAKASLDVWNQWLARPIK